MTGWVMLGIWEFGNPGGFVFGGSQTHEGLAAAGTARCLRPPLPLFHMRYTKSRRQAILAGSIALKQKPKKACPTEQGQLVCGFFHCRRALNEVTWGCWPLIEQRRGSGASGWCLSERGTDAVRGESARGTALEMGNLYVDAINQDLFGALGARRGRAAIVVVVAARDRVAASLLGGQWWARDEGRPGCR